MGKVHCPSELTKVKSLLSNYSLQSFLIYLVGTSSFSSKPLLQDLGSLIDGLEKITARIAGMKHSPSNYVSQY